MPQLYNARTAYNPLDFETRRVQSNGRSLVTVLPKLFTDRLGIVRGDMIRFHIHAADRKKLVIEKIDFGYDEHETEPNKEIEEKINVG